MGLNGPGGETLPYLFPTIYEIFQILLDFMKINNLSTALMALIIHPLHVPDKLRILVIIYLTALTKEWNTLLSKY